MRKLVIRADDLGYSEAVNYGIERTVRRGCVRSVGVMSNMLAAAHGVELLAGCDVAFGLHACISAGSPVCAPEEVPSLVGEDGRFLPSSAYRAGEDVATFDDAYREVRAQLRHLEELLGRRADYLDVHAVASIAFMRAIAAVAEEEGLPCSLLPDADGQATVGSTSVKLLLPAQIPSTVDDARALFFSELDAVPQHGCAIAVCHPGYIDAELMTTSSLVQSRPLEVAVLSDPALSERLVREGFELIDYRNL